MLKIRRQTLCILSQGTIKIHSEVSAEKIFKSINLKFAGKASKMVRTPTRVDDMRV